MDVYASFQRRINSLREEMVNEIRNILFSKGYSIGDTPHSPSIDFDILGDRILINGSHPDHLPTDKLVEAVRQAIHTPEKNVYDISICEDYSKSKFTDEQIEFIKSCV